MVRRTLQNQQHVLTSLQNYYASNILQYLSLASSKCSVAAMIIAIQPQRWMVVALYSVVGISILWAIAAAFTMGLQCGPTRWVLGPTENDTCISQYRAQIGLKLVDIVTDLALVALPAAMAWTVQIRTFKKFVVTLMFGLRIVYVRS